MAKTIEDYQREYQEARKRGDAAGMQAANDGANAIRQSQGQSAQYATSDINKYKNNSGTNNVSVSSGNTSSGGGKSSSSSGSYQNYTGGNQEMDNKLSYWQNKYQEARQNGDWQGMQNANNEANKIRNEYGYAAQHATDDINKYRPSESGSGSWGSGYYNQGYMNNMNNWYSQIQSELEAAQKAAVEQAVGQLESQKDDIDQSYDDLYRQLYMDRRRAEKNLPQQLAAMGISGGMTESAALGIQNDYSNALQQGEREKLNTLRGIDQAISDARLTGDIGLAQQAAELAMNQLNTYADTIAAMQAQQNWQKQFDASNSQWQQQFDTANKQWQMQWDRQGVLDQIARDDISYDRKLFAAQYLYESTGDSSGLKMLGYTDAQIAALRNSYAQAMAQKTRSSGGGGGGDDEGTPYFGKKDDEDTAQDNGSSSQEWAGIDLNSVTALGYGPISRAELERLVDSGEVEAYQDPVSGLIKVRRGQKESTPGISQAGNFFNPGFWR